MTEAIPFEPILDDGLSDEALDEMGNGKVCYHVSAFSFWPGQQH